MKTLLLALALTSSAAFGMSGFPDGRYGGHGAWKSAADGSGEYTAETTIAANQVCTVYTWDGGSDTFCFQATFAADGFFEVEHGWGYCYDYQCHYQVEIGGGMIEETLTFVDDNLFKVGSKKFGGGSRIVWQEALLELAK